MGERKEMKKKGLPYEVPLDITTFYRRYGNLELVIRHQILDMTKHGRLTLGHINSRLNELEEKRRAVISEEERLLIIAEPFLKE